MKASAAASREYPDAEEAKSANVGGKNLEQNLLEVKKPGANSDKNACAVSGEMAACVRRNNPRGSQPL